MIVARLVTTASGSVLLGVCFWFTDGASSGMAVGDVADSFLYQASLESAISEYTGSTSMPSRHEGHFTHGGQGSTRGSPS